MYQTPDLNRLPEVPHFCRGQSSGREQERVRYWNEATQRERAIYYIKVSGIPSGNKLIKTI